ncbi:MAG: TIGR03663 family protein [Chloroflexi bacterium]|nr:TIGR03663 family protein [Chloroflexota bacterium]
MINNKEQRSWLERPIHPSLPALTNEIIIFAVVILAAIATRFYDLGTRVMSHDESLITYFSWLLYKGNGYQHTPMMHGPLEFYLTAISYFLFGPSDFSARIPPAVFSIATIWMAWYWRRYLGKAGALIAGFLMVISPYMLFYGRYARNEVYGSFSGVVMLYVMLRYLETGYKRYIYLVTAALILHFVDKSTAFIYSAQALLFLASYFIIRITRRPWANIGVYRAFIISLSAAVLLIAATLGTAAISKGAGTITGSETVLPANPAGTTSPLTQTASPLSPTTIPVVAALAALAAAVYFLIRGYGWDRIRSERSFDLLILIGTLIIPTLTPFPLRLLNWTIPTTAPEVAALTTTDALRLGAFLIPAFIISIIVGQWWDSKTWWKTALLFWSVYIAFYTTFFTNSSGLFTGLIGMLGYWLVQQGVQRGSQPWYFYILIQIPIYEFLPALGALLAFYLGLRRLRHTSSARVESEAMQENIKDSHIPAQETSDTQKFNFGVMFSLLAWWSVSSVIAYSFAGEKMPWLTYHITWSMILLTGWGLGYLIETADWEGLRRRRAVLVLTLVATFLFSLSVALLALFGSQPPFRGNQLDQLQATLAFLLPAVVAIVSAGGLVYLFREWTGSQVARAFTLTFFALLAVLTIRASFRASYINYDDATEYLVYAHAATGVKDVINQATEISQRTTGGMGINIAYDASAPDTGVSWPFVWYLRDFTNQKSFDQPTRALRDSTIVIVDAKNFDKIEQALGPGYYRIDYIRMWWPNQDYFGLVNDRQPTPFDDSYSCKGALSFFKLFKTKDFSRICSAIADPKIRAGIINIWLNRDYTLYAEATGNANLTLATWQPSDQMRMYIRKDVVSQIWKYGALPTQQTTDVDPYKGKTATLTANQIIDSTKLSSPPMNAPRSLAFAPDGTLYVADSRNHRILHFDASGTLINQWGTPTGNDPNNPTASAPPSTFNEPWGVAVGPDGSVYVTDTWNHRVQKFTSDGQFIKTWGTFGQGTQTDTFYGPRGIAVDSQGRVYVVDTGNKRVVVFDADGNYVTQFGSEGLDPGQFDEPVGIAIDANGRVYVADTWNQRIQSFQPSEDGLTFTPLKQWDVAAWYGQSLDNKPFIAVDSSGRVFITDPDGYRVIEYTADGQLIQTWGDYGDTPSTFGIAAGIAVDKDGNIWVTDAGNNRVMKFTLP